MKKNISPKEIELIINHVFLPPKLPDESDYNAVEIAEALLSFTHRALSVFLSHAADDDKTAITTAARAIKSLLGISDSYGFIESSKLLSTMRGMSEGDYLPISIKAQNAAIIVSRGPESVMFEFFELSPTNRAVMSTSGRLKRRFPGSAVTLPLSKFADGDLFCSLARTIAKMSFQEVPEMKHFVMKAGQSQIEERETTDPGIVTELLSRALQAFAVHNQISSIEKNTREEIILNDGTLPWRRSSMWLLIRVTVQTILSRHAKDSTVYKQFMIYLMALLTQLSQESPLKSDILHCMIAKISGRFLKLGRNDKYAWMLSVDKILAHAISCLENIWQNVVQQSSPDWTVPMISVDSILRDKHAAFPKLDAFIQSIYAQQKHASKHSFKPKWWLKPWPKNVLPNLSFRAEQKGEEEFALLEFEYWVATHLHTWLQTNMTLASTPSNLSELVESYHRRASERYRDSPESLSLMFLTIIELWIACDESACAQYPLILDYDHQVPFEFLQSLILPSKRQMERLIEAELYLKSRREEADYKDLPNIFTNFGTQDSFGVRFFMSSKPHQDLMESITKTAECERREKSKELEELKKEYKELLQIYSTSTHKYVERRDRQTGLFTTIHDKKGCTCCAARQRAQKMSIQVHEWPLPENQLAAKNVVFELMVPRAISSWRNCTAFLLSDVFGSYYADPHNDYKYGLLSECLSEYFTSHGPARFELASTTKLNQCTHRNPQMIATTNLSHVLLNNGQRFHYYDTFKSTWVVQLQTHEVIPKQCTYKVSEQNAELGKILLSRHDKHHCWTPNDIIASQNRRHDNLSLEEFRAMATLPLGCRIQWSNILTQLCMPAIDFKKEDTLHIILQACLQAGPPLGSATTRAGHSQPTDKAFAFALLDGLTSSLERVEENWESCHALEIFIKLATRVLTLTPTDSVATAYLLFLTDCRVVADQWLTRLHDKVKHLETDREQIEFRRIVHKIALICLASFDVDSRDLDMILADPSQATMLITSSIHVRNTMQNMPQDQQSITTLRMSQILDKSLECLSHEIVDKVNPCLDRALAKSWTGYPGKCLWQTAHAPYKHWLKTEVFTNDYAPQTIHYNLLNGELLVDCLPISHLPTEYSNHETYVALFGNMPLEVVHSGLAGMKYLAKEKLGGHSLYIGKSDDEFNDFLVTAMRSDQTYHLVPSRVFTELLPDKFVDEYFHWYNASLGDIEFREKQHPWSFAGKDLWLLKKYGRKWFLERQDGHILITPTTDIARLLAETLSPLESITHIHITSDKSMKRLAIELPRLQLDFVLGVESNLMISRQFRNMYIDKVQDIGCLTGLRSRLVLRDSQGRRKVLILDGPPVWWRNDNKTHVVVAISHEKSKKTFSYDVDSTLGRLVDNGSLQGKLHICYLHALTSFCLPDKLTGKTGTEEALSILNSASVRSFDYLSEENMRMLEKIGKLAPHRQFYPKKIRSMERIEWDGYLSCLSQSVALYKAVGSILDQFSTTSFFYPESSTYLILNHHVNEHLALRHAIRMSNFQVPGFGAENFSSQLDTFYESRDRLSISPRAIRVLEVSCMLSREDQKLSQSLDNLLVCRLQNFFMGTIQGSLVNIEIATICYDLDWLGDQVEVLHKYWCRLYDAFSKGASPGQFDTIMCFSAMAYSTCCDFQILQALAATVKFDQVGKVELPVVEYFLTEEGCDVARSIIARIASQHLRFTSECPEYYAAAQEFGSQLELEERRNLTFLKNRKSAINKFVTDICNLLNCASPACPADIVDIHTHESGIYIDTRGAMCDIKKAWEIWHVNYQFDQHIRSLVADMKQFDVKQISPNEGITIVDDTKLPAVPKPILTWKDMFADHVPELLDTSEESLNLGIQSSGPVEIGARLSHLLDRLRKLSSTEHVSEQSYVKELEASLESLVKRAPADIIIAKEFEVRTLLEEYLSRCDAHRKDVWAAICEALDANLKSKVFMESCKENEGCKALANFMAPRLSTSLLLEHLARQNLEALSMPWRRVIVAYALAITKVQRAKRMLNLSDKLTELLEELKHPGHQNWDPLESPDALLLEVESGILIRDVQTEIVARMRSPPKGHNAVLQLNMGEGKSSVIVPIVASHLGDGTKLVRVVVAKPQAKELYRTLVSKLGGLLNRRIFHMPFFRALKPTKEQIRSVHEHYKNCMAQGGILLVQPEHILSLELMGIESGMTEAHKEITRAIADVQHFFNLHSRDIVDESDENFSPKFELIYTMGTQKYIEFSPDRWLAAQRLLEIIASVAPKIQEEYPESINSALSIRGGFPWLRILRQDAGRALLSAAARHICDVGFPGLPIARQSKTMRDAVFRYISEDVPSDDTISLVERNSAVLSDSTKGLLFILRGLIAGQVILFVFSQKRWRVNYGLDRSRRPGTRLAVPYRAKDSPTLRSEFSHQDMVIQVTCLSYYYGGLSDDELLATLEHLMNSGQADTKYDELVVDAPNLPTGFRRLVSINIRDIQQLKSQVFPCLRFGKKVIDYFLAQLVFPKELKEFPYKLSASGWDLGKKKPNPTTGFSGTKDSQHLLPLQVKQLDLEDQRHTNALVLENLLGPENTVKMLLPADAHDQTSDAQRLLTEVASSTLKIQVLLDVGAQILELTNVEVAKQWLRLLPSDAKQEAVVYFNDYDELCVIDHKNQIEGLRTSPYAEQLDLCLVFLDEAHTRGTDLKLPDNYRAAVTLGPNLAKDRLVQACMRMRKLGKGQSVVFFVSPEMQSRINTSNKNDEKHQINTEDVLIWAIHETHCDLRRLMPLWAIQGLRFERQQKLWQSSTRPGVVYLSPEKARAFLEDDTRLIEQQYRPRASDLAKRGYSSFHTFGDSLTKNGAAIQQRCEDFGIKKFESCALQEEQEKEVAPEIEQERHVESSPSSRARNHHIDPVVKSFVATGILNPFIDPFSLPIIPAFVSLKNTSAAALLDLSQLPSALLVTQDFATTVELDGSEADSYLRPVQWILSTANEKNVVQKLIIISPYEANELMLEIQGSKHVHLHLYSPRTNLAFDALDSLELYTVPPVKRGWELPSRLRLQLNLFAGQLYFGSFQDYRETCEMLGLAWETPREDEFVEADGFIRHGRRSLQSMRLQKSPIPCLKTILQKLRRDQHDIEKTHWGKIFAGEILTERDFAVASSATMEDEMMLTFRPKW